MTHDDDMSIAGVPLVAHEPPKKDDDDHGMGVVFKETRKEPTENKLDMDAPLTAPRMQGTAPIKRRSLLTNTDDVFDVGGAFKGDQLESGTIVTDKRHKRVDFGEAVTGAFSEWYGNVSKKLRGMELLKKKEPKTIASSENRKEVIKQAVVSERQVPQDDHAVVIERFKTLSHDAERITGKPYLIKKDGEIRKAETDPHTPPVEHKEIPEPKPIVKPVLQKEVVKQKPTLDLRSISVAPKVEHHIPSNISAHKPENQGAATAVPPMRTMPKSALPVQPVSVPPRNENVAALSTKQSHIPATQPRVIHEEIVAPQAQEERKPASNSEWSFLINDGESKSTERPAPVTQPMQARVAPVATAVVVKPEEKIEKMVEEVRPQIKERVAVPIPPPTPKPVVVPTPPVTSEPPRISNTQEFSLPTNPPVSTASTISVTKSSEQQKRTFLYIIVILLIIVVGGAAGVGTALYVSKNRNTPETEVGAPAVSSFFAVNSLTEVAFSSSRNILLSSVYDATEKAPQGITHIYISRDKDLPNTEDIFAVIAPHASSRFVRGLDETMMIGSVTTSKNEPFIILRSDAFDSTFAGMLEWESYMQEDLTPLFGTPDVQNSRFKDALSQNRSIRVLNDAGGNERMIYAFVNRTTVVITTSTEALSTIIGKIR